MRKLVVSTFLTLDGVMQGPGGPDEDRDGGFEHGGWMLNYRDDIMLQLIVDLLLQVDALLLGRRTYDIFAGYWPHVPEADNPISAKMNNVRKYVASRTLSKAEWNNSTVIQGDVASAVARLKQEAGSEVQVMGSSGLIQTLLRHYLVDEFRLWVCPVVLGTGKRLFADGTVPTALRLVETRTSTTGVVVHRYEMADKIEHGSFALGQSGT